MERCTTASCFTTFMLPHILFVDDFQERQKVVATCCLAWNISLFPDADEREQHIDVTWKMVVADNREAPPPGLEEGFKRDLRMLVERKLDLFPWLMANIPTAELAKKMRHDVLCIETDGEVEEVELVTHLDIAGLPHIIDMLRRLHKNTAEQVDLMHRVRRSGGVEAVFSDLEAEQMATAYCRQRADLIGYHRMLTEWGDAEPDPSVKCLIRHWLGVIGEIEEHSKAVLALLTEEHISEC
jgi:hypothetical protein